MKEKHNYPVTTLLSKSQYLRIKDYASIRNVSVSKILRQYIDDNCPSTGAVALFRAERSDKFNTKLLETLGTAPLLFRAGRDEELRNKLLEILGAAPTLDIDKSYWCRVCSDHVDTYTEGEDTKCKTCDNYVIGG